MNSKIETTTETKVDVEVWRDKLEIYLPNSPEKIIMSKDEGEALFMCLEHLYGKK